MRSTHKHGNFTMRIFEGKRKWKRHPGAYAYTGKRSFGLLIVFLALFVGISATIGCGGGGGGGQGEGSHTGTSSGDLPYEQWEKIEVARIEAGGMLSPRVRAVFDKSGKVHLVYFQNGNSPQDGSQDAQSAPYGICYLTVDPQGTSSTRKLSAPEPESVIGIDNCAALSLAIGQDNLPLIAYRGGVIRECGMEQQSDAMLSVKEAEVNGWEEYTGAIGVVERNPVFHDGLAGTEVSAAVDSQGNIHLAYQFFYEGCDAMNTRYPDLCYVRKDRSAIHEAALEETVEGNQYDGDNIQNSVGYHCVITLDKEENPVIFSYAELPDHSRGLRVARKRNGVWESEWIDKGCVVGSISCARCDVANEGSFLGVAYYVEEYGEEYQNAQLDNHCLRYAQEDASSWRIRTVDATSWCGDYCSLAYDGQGYAAIAYYELKSHSGYVLNNLKLARLQGGTTQAGGSQFGTWKSGIVASGGDIGLYNSLWFDENNKPVICSYSRTENTIFLFSPIMKSRE